MNPRLTENEFAIAYLNAVGTGIRKAAAARVEFSERDRPNIPGEKMIQMHEGTILSDYTLPMTHGGYRAGKAETMIAVEVGDGQRCIKARFFGTGSVGVESVTIGAIGQIGKCPSNGPSRP